LGGWAGGCFEFVAGATACVPGGFGGRGGSVMGGRNEDDAATSSKDSSRLSPSSVPVPVHSRSKGDAYGTPAAAESLASESETE
jgi:hypothetical protein